MNFLRWILAYLIFAVVLGVISFSAEQPAMRAIAQPLFLLFLVLAVVGITGTAFRDPDLKQ